MYISDRCYCCCWVDGQLLPLLPSEVAAATAVFDGGCRLQPLLMTLINTAAAAIGLSCSTSFLNLVAMVISKVAENSLNV
ncbi:MAG: hypothetical protein Q8755_02950, partial [Candidatus Phytoplasma australasiaticum]|nr:hypothetical protein [Candidatus Phytoplasma australasiaticum]